MDEIGPMNFEIVIDEKRQYNLDLSKMLAISESELRSQILTQPKCYAWAMSLAAMARRKSRTLKADLDVAEAKFGQQLREGAANSGEKITEKSIQDQVLMNRNLIIFRTEILKAEEQMEICIAAGEAFRQRKDCLLELAALQRSEGSVEPALMEDLPKKGKKK